jgi:GNAT superfamily N-acetyltransferase
MLLVKELTGSDIITVYNEHMVNDFPDNELKPLWAVKRLAKNGLYHAYGLFEDATLRGYAFFASANNDQAQQQTLLLDYFATLAGGRSRGYGTKFLRLLKNQLHEDFPNCRGIIAEVERVSKAANESEKKMRERRIAFYKRSGFRRTRIKSQLFGVDFALLFQPYQPNKTETEKCDLTDDSFIIEQMNLIYAAMLPAPVRKLNVKFWLK